MGRWIMGMLLALVLVNAALAQEFSCTRCLPAQQKLHRGGLVRCGECTAAIEVGGLAATLACAICADDGSSVTCDRCEVVWHYPQ